MTSAPLEPAAVPTAPSTAPAHTGSERVRRRLGFAAIAACLPYLTMLFGRPNPFAAHDGFLGKRGGRTAG